MWLKRICICNSGDLYLLGSVLSVQLLIPVLIVLSEAIVMLRRLS